MHGLDVGLPAKSEESLKILGLVKEKDAEYKNSYRRGKSVLASKKLKLFSPPKKGVFLLAVFYAAVLRLFIFFIYLLNIVKKIPVASLLISGFVA